jgi:hypothetical protein
MLSAGHALHTLVAQRTLCNKKLGEFVRCERGFLVHAIGGRCGPPRNAMSAVGSHAPRITRSCDVFNGQNMAVGRRLCRSAWGGGCVKTPHSVQNGCARSDLKLSARLWSVRTGEIPTKIGLAAQSPEFSHSLGGKRTRGKAASFSTPRSSGRRAAIFIRRSRAPTVHNDLY